MLGQRLTRQLADGGPMYYWATLEPRDGEDRAIVRRHLAERDGWGFETIEQGRQLPQALKWVSPAGTVLFDSITACLACQMFSAPEPDGEAPRRTAEELLVISRHPAHFVCVCDELWRDGVAYETWTETYRRGLAEICRTLAAEFDVVCELTAGLRPGMEGGVAGCVIGYADFSWPGGCSWPFPAPGRYGAKAPGRKCWCACPWWACWPEAYGPGRGFCCGARRVRCGRRCAPPHPWLVTGFMHLDGYMDVCDAVLSRRELATRQRILKDSHCGAFAVIGMVLLALCQWSVFLSGSAGESLWGLLLIPVATRACAGLAVLKLRPMGTSQYAAMGRHGGYAAALAVLLATAIAVPLVIDRSFAPLAAAAGYGLAVWYGFRQLDGMNGDISGFSLTLGELAGAAVWTLVR